MKANGTYSKWRASSESSEARVLGYKNMVKNGKVNNLIKASNTPDVLRRKQESRVKSGSFDNFMKASREKTKFLWQNDPKYRAKQLKNLKRGFDRKEFYESKLEIIRFNSLDKKISLIDINDLIGVPGVWSKETSSGNVLDVSETINIGAEMLMSIRAFNANKDRTDKDLNKKSRPYFRKKYRDMHKYSKGEIIFKLIAIDIENKEERESIEAQYAHDTKAIFWSPAPGQNKIINQLKP